MGRKAAGVYLFLVAFNVLAWLWALAEFHGHAVLLGSAVLAYTFGLRHAFDVDHIAAIDTVTRKLMQQNRCSMMVGFYFAIGHSLLVFVATFAVIAALHASAAAPASSVMGSLRLPVVSTIVSASFLLLMAAINLLIARTTWEAVKRVRAGGEYVEEELDLLLGKRGFLARLFRPLFRLVNRSWHMGFIGLLFGLGFDTATEVSLLGIAAAEVAHGASVLSILVFPTLFAAGMMLMDTTDSVLMSGAYGWAFRHPVRKLYYNLTITSLSAVVALVIGGIEAAALVSQKFNLTGLLWQGLEGLSGSWGTIGFVVVLLFLFSWAVSILWYRSAAHRAG